MTDHKKNTGSFYTPLAIASKMVLRIKSFLQSGDSILEPSVGDGIFISEISNLNKKIKLTALDINSKELHKAKSKSTISYARFKKLDYLEFTTSKKFDLIIGNPPYIKKSRLSEAQLNKCHAINDENNLPNSCVKNLWITFLLKSISLLKKDGIISFVLPSDLLQHKYSKHILTHIQSNFDRIEIITFDSLLFEAKGQDTIILTAFKKHKEKGIFFSKDDKKVKDKTAEFSTNPSLVKADIKWTHHFLLSDEIEFLSKLVKGIPLLRDISDSKPGIVTAANKYFIVDKKTEEDFNLANYTHGIIQKGVFVNGKLSFTEKDFKELEHNEKPTRLISVKPQSRLNLGLKNYLEIGVKEKIDKRYKCSKRDKWYIIPNVGVKSNILFFKRSHLYPKLLINEANVYVTDSAYCITPKKSYTEKNIVYSFYNSLTLLFAELNGRYYGGGVLELTPSEFKSLPIPYTKLKSSEFNKFKTAFKNKNSIDEILKKNDAKVLCKINLNKDEIRKIQAIKTKLVKKRLRI